jgi:membrane-bound serine protease (ClpP class)
MNPFILLVIGFVLIFFEFYLPGAVMGIAGGVFVLLSLISFALASESPVAVGVYAIAIGISLYFLIKFAIWRIRTAKPSRSIYSADSQDGAGYQAVNYDQTAIGKEGIVLTDLKPAGFIMIEGKQHPAISREGYLSKGVKIKVIGGEESNLIVRKE